LPLPPTVCAEPLNDTGALPVEKRTLAVQTAPGDLYKAYSVGYEPYETGFGLTAAHKRLRSLPLFRGFISDDQLVLV